MRVPGWLRQHVAALRLLLTMTVIFGVGYPLVVTAIAQVPGLQHRANGSLIHLNGKVVGSAVIGQSFTDAQGNPIAKYFQSRPSAAGAGYDPTSTGASNLGPESIIDPLPDPAGGVDGQSGNAASPSLLTDVCTRSIAVGKENSVNGLRPYCTTTGLGAVLSVIHADGVVGRVVKVVSVNQECPAKPFISSYDGLAVQCATYGVDYRVGRITPVRGAGKPWPANPVPPDAVTASGSGLDPDISVDYADLQSKRVAEARGLPVKKVLTLVEKYTSGRTLGFMGEPAVNVLQLNLALDQLPGQ